MKNRIVKKLKRVKEDKKEILKEPLKVLKKIDLNKFKKITSFSLNKTFDNFKERIKKAEIEREKILKKEKIQEAKKKNIR